MTKFSLPLKYETFSSFFFGGGLYLMGVLSYSSARSQTETNIEEQECGL